MIAELKFVFWQRMFTRRHDAKIWDQQIEALFPNAETTTPRELCQRIYDDLDVIRRLRNRLAHHEPVFTRNLSDDLSKMLDLVQMRCKHTADWVRDLENVSTLLAVRP